MKKPSVIRMFCLLGIMMPALYANQALAQTRELSTSGQLLDRVVAVVNDGVVLQSELEAQMRLITQRLTEQGVQLPPRGVLRQQVLERLIIGEIQMQRAARLDIRVTDEQLNSTLARVAASNNVPFEQLPQVLAQQGIDYADYRDEMRREMTISQLRQRDVDARINVSDRELDQFMEEQSAAGSAEFELSHILISIPSSATPEQLKIAEEKAQTVYRRLLQGEEFGEMAVSFSDAQDALEGGYLGWRNYAQVPTIFAEIVPNMTAGQVSEPIRSPSGFHIIKMGEIRGVEPVYVTQSHLRHILLTTNELKDDATVEGELEAIRQRILDGEDFGAVALAVSEDPGSGSEGGDLGWTEPGTFVPEFEKEIQSLRVGQISEPFKTRFGWHIVELIEVREYDSTEDKMRNEAYMAILQRKVAEQSEIWVRQLRDQAFVEYKL